MAPDLRTMSTGADLRCRSRLKGSCEPWSNNFILRPVDVCEPPPRATVSQLLISCTIQVLRWLGSLTRSGNCTVLAAGMITNPADCSPHLAHGTVVHQHLAYSHTVSSVVRTTDRSAGTSSCHCAMQLQEVDTIDVTVPELSLLRMCGTNTFSCCPQHDRAVSSKQTEVGSFSSPEEAALARQPSLCNDNQHLPVQSEGAIGSCMPGMGSFSRQSF